ncbi:DUF2256 domain-containing protein [Planctomycetaceae bacterium SH139]
MTRSKSDLPSKICPVCRRPFAWRKKWARCWNEVKYCSQRCRRQGGHGDPARKPACGNTGGEA